MSSIDNILSFISKINASNREVEQACGLSNGTLSKAKVSGEISSENLEKFLEKYSTALGKEGFLVVDFGPALNGAKVILTPDEKQEIEGIILGKEYSNNVEANHTKLNKALPLGDINFTVKDYIDKVEQHNEFLQYVIKNGLVSLETNLARGQQEIKEQILVTATAAVQQLSGQVPAVPMQARGKGVAGKRKEVDGDGKGKGR